MSDATTSDDDRAGTSRAPPPASLYTEEAIVPIESHEQASPSDFDAKDQEWFDEYDECGRRRSVRLSLSKPTKLPLLDDPIADRWFR